ncbi:hypothetical protein [Thalassobius sp. I31.1]|uniref:hypothetical protein n=1 Tax=Thalassobius sp. I31.1 TaxID=2109912 RepID=UPI000D1A1BAF|nr:hypothetical protein [Thalassobius sp. I31.1]
MKNLKMLTVGTMALMLAGCAGIEIPDLRGGFGDRETPQATSPVVTEQVAEVEAAIPQTSDITTTTLGDPQVDNTVIDRSPCIIGGDNSGRPHCPQG